MVTSLEGLGDRRLDATFNVLVKRVSDVGRLVIRKLAYGRWEEVKFGRFLSNKRFTFSDMIDSAVQLLDPVCAGRDVLLIEDSSEVSFGYEPFQQGLAAVGNGKEEGFYLHPVIAMDADDNLCLGLAALELFKRKTSTCALRDKLPFEAKQSYRWLSAARSARSACMSARRHTVVTDREGDIYEALCGYGDSSLDFVVRCWHDRTLEKNADVPSLWQFINTWPVALLYSCPLPRTDKRSAHEARLQLKYGQVNLPRPERIKGNSPEFLPIYVVEVCEEDATVVNNEKPVHWILLTSHEVKNAETARLIVSYYSKRWNIEQVFRLLKSQGLQIQHALQHSFESLTKVAVLGLIAALRVLQLVTARQHSKATMDMAFDEKQIQLIEILSPTLEGKTLIQKNPHPKHTLAFAAWVIARLGGWKGYSKSERPPGPITMFNGLRKFQHYLEAYSLFAKLNDT